MDVRVGGKRVNVAEGGIGVSVVVDTLVLIPHAEDAASSRNTMSKKNKLCFCVV
jgi:hypothetical protein